MLVRPLVGGENSGRTGCSAAAAAAATDAPTPSPAPRRPRGGSACRRGALGSDDQAEVVVPQPAGDPSRRPTGQRSRPVEPRVERGGRRVTTRRNRLDPIAQTRASGLRIEGEPSGLLLLRHHRSRPRALAGHAVDMGRATTDHEIAVSEQLRCRPAHRHDLDVEARAEPFGDAIGDHVGVAVHGLVDDNGAHRLIPSRDPDSPAVPTIGSTPSCAAQPVGTRDEGPWSPRRERRTMGAAGRPRPGEETR